MDKKIKQICRDVKNGKLLEENIPSLFNYLTDQYHAYAGVRLVMHYVTLYEAYLDEGSLWSQDAMDLTDRLNNLIRDNILNQSMGHAHQEIIASVDQIRNGIMHRMKLLTAFTDVLINFEYILNRIEYRFKDECVFVEDDDELAREILRYIFDSQDNVIINEKIKDMLGQLPIRISRQKYFELLKESMHNYLGAQKASLNTYLYLLRSAAMLEPIDELEKMYPFLWEAKTFLFQLDYQKLDQSEYEQAREKIEQAATLLNRESSFYFGLQEVINEVYAILLCSPYSGMDQIRDENTDVILALLKDVNGYFMNKEQKELSSENLEQLIGLEGLQEELTVKLTEPEDTLYTVDIYYRYLVESIMLDKVMNVLLRTRDLLSSSIFIDWEEKEEDGMVGEKELDEEAAKLEAELTVLFADQDKSVMRSVMANTLNKLPVFFKDHKEVMDYVRYSLQRCSDPYEKAACREIILDIIHDSN